MRMTVCKLIMQTQQKCVAHFMLYCTTFTQALLEEMTRPDPS